MVSFIYPRARLTRSGNFLMVHGAIIVLVYGGLVEAVNYKAVATRLLVGYGLSVLMGVGGFLIWYFLNKGVSSLSIF